MKRRHGIFLVCMFLTLTLLLLATGCDGRTIITGSYRSEPSRDLSDVKIQLSLIDLENNEHHYSVRLQPDGSFRFSVRLSGQYVFSSAISDYSKEKWSLPVLSNAGDLILIQIPQSGILQLGTYYISEAIQILSPANEQIISLSGDFEFSWEMNPLAQYYRVSIYNWKDSGERAPVVSIFNLIDANLKLSAFQEFEQVKGMLDFQTIKKKGPFKRQGQELSPGEYGLRITGYAADEENNRFVEIVRSIDERSFTLVE